MKKSKGGGEEDPHDDHGHKNRAAQLPPGSFGWPYIGETLQLYSQDPNTFFSSRQKRYVIAASFLFLVFNLLSFHWFMIH